MQNIFRQGFFKIELNEKKVKLKNEIKAERFFNVQFENCSHFYTIYCLSL